jgi:glutaminase
MIKLNIEEFKTNLEEIYNKVSKVNKGKVADYIPQLAEVNCDLFAVSVCTVDGHIINIGDTLNEFTLQSCIKHLLYLKACKDNTSDVVGLLMNFVLMKMDCHITQ